MDSVHVRQWLQTENATIFKLSNGITQVKFNDGAEILIDSIKSVVTLVNKLGERTKIPVEFAKTLDKEEIQYYLLQAIDLDNILTKSNPNQSVSSIQSLSTIEESLQMS